MPTSHLLIENLGAVQLVTINNPKKRNALNLQTYKDLTDALNDASKNEAINVVVLTGIGQFYSSGNDISQALVAEGSVEEKLKKSGTILYDMIKAFYSFDKLLIAIVNGPCIGIAATTVALCDVIYAADLAYFYTPFTALGLCAEGCSSYTFPKILGKTKASEMLLLNHKLSALEALQFNFISEIYKGEELKTKIWPKIVEYSMLPIGSLKVCKNLMKKFEIKELEEANDRESEALAQRWMTEEAMMAVINFMNRKSKL